MLNRSQLMTLIILRNRSGNFFSSLPGGILNHIRKMGDDARSTESDIAKLLHHVILANPEKARIMLEANPRLLLEAGDVVAPSGDLILRVTPYECALGAGDHHDDMAPMIASFFSKIDEGEKERARQYARYKPYIDKVIDQVPYKIYPLFKIIKRSSDKDVTAALKMDMSSNSDLQKALIKFRKDFAPSIIKQGMHFNYASLQGALTLYESVYDNLRNRDNFDKCDLFWRQVIGFMMRRLPACDRQAFAAGLYFLRQDDGLFKRDFDFRYGDQAFPDTTSDDDLTGLGFEYAVEALGSMQTIEGPPRNGWDSMRPWVSLASYFETYVLHKQACLLANTEPKERQEVTRGIGLDTGIKV